MNHLTVNPGFIFLIVVGTMFFYYANKTINTVPFLKEIISVLVIGVGLWFLLQSLGLVHGGPVMTHS